MAVGHLPPQLFFDKPGQPDQGPDCPVQRPAGPDHGPELLFVVQELLRLAPGWCPVDRVLGRLVRSGVRLTGFLNRVSRFSLLFFPKPKPKEQIDGKRWNWRLKVGEIVDQAQQHRIHGPKPLKMQPYNRSVKRQFRAIFGDFVENFLETKSGGWRVKIAVTKSC
jgi:hypothetical protein